jgi:hypothetical protein
MQILQILLIAQIPSFGRSGFYYLITNMSQAAWPVWIFFAGLLTLHAEKKKTFSRGACSARGKPRG